MSRTCRLASDELALRTPFSHHELWLNHLIPEAVQLSVLKSHLPSFLAFLGSGLSVQIIHGIHEGTVSLA